MPIGDISTTKQFVNGQLGVDGSDLNAIVGQSSIQPAFFSAQSSGSSPGDSDYLLFLSGGGTFYKLLYSNFFTNAKWVRAQIGPQYVSTINGDFSVWQLGTSFTNPLNLAYTADMWQKISTAGGLSGGGKINVSQIDLLGSLVPNGAAGYVPRYGLRATVNTVQASMAAGDYIAISQRIERSQARRLFAGVTSLAIWIRTSVAGTYTVSIQDSLFGQTFKQDFNIGTPNVWQQCQMQNIPVFPVAGNYGSAETDFSYVINVALCCGSTFQSATQSTWLSGKFYGSASTSNFVANTGATLDMCLLQHENGNVCTPFQPDPSLSISLQKCQRYIVGLSTYSLGTAFSASDSGASVIPINMRAAPTLSAGATFTVSAGTAGTPVIASVTSADAQINNSGANWTVGALVSVTGSLIATL